MGKKKVKTEVEADTYLRKLITTEIEECAKENSVDLSDNETAMSVEAVLDIVEAPIYMLLESLVADVLDRVVNGELPESDSDDGEDEGEDSEEESETEEEEEEEEELDDAA